LIFGISFRTSHQGGGEKVNKKILGIALTVSFLAMLTIPVMAAPATKIEGVTATAVVTQTPDHGFPHMASHNTIMHGKGTSVGTVTLTIPNPQDPQNPTVLTGDWAGEWVSMSNWKEDPVVVNIRGKVVWTFTGTGTTGTFVGIIQRKITGFPPDPPTVIPYFEDNVVLRGTGDFQGQTLKLTFEGYPPVIQEGCLIIPK
jgi:hypothetical protein